MGYDFSGKQLVGGVLFTVFLAAGLILTGQQMADTSGQQSETSSAPAAKGTFSQIGLDETGTDSLEEPFLGINEFDDITADTSANNNDELTDAAFNWTVENGTDLGLKERTVVAYHEVEDGAMDSVEYTLQQGANYSKLDKITEAAVYDYDAAVNQGSLGQPVARLSVDTKEHTADNSDNNVRLSEGKYGLVVTYRFDSATDVPSTEGNTLGLNTLKIVGKSDATDAVETIKGIPIQVYAK